MVELVGCGAGVLGVGLSSSGVRRASCSKRWSSSGARGANCVWGGDGAEGSTEVVYTGLERHRLLCHFQAEGSTGVGTIQ